MAWGLYRWFFLVPGNGGNIPALTLSPHGMSGGSLSKGRALVGNCRIQDIAEEAAFCCVSPKISLNLTWCRCSHSPWLFGHAPSREHPTLNPEPSTFSANIFLWVWVEPSQTFFFNEWGEMNQEWLAAHARIWYLEWYHFRTLAAIAASLCSSYMSRTQRHRADWKHILSWSCLIGY